MSTTHIIYKDDFQNITITEHSGKLDLDLETPNCDFFGPQNMKPEQALLIAVGILYAAWVVSPDMANIFVGAMTKDRIPDVWNQIVRARNETPPTDYKIP